MYLTNLYANDTQRIYSMRDEYYYMTISILIKG